MKLPAKKSFFLVALMLLIGNTLFAKTTSKDTFQLVKKVFVQTEEVIYGITNIDECDLSIGIPLLLDDDNKPKELKYSVGNASPNQQQYQDTNFVWTQFVKTIPKNFLEDEHVLHIIEVL